MVLSQSQITACHLDKALLVTKYVLQAVLGFVDDRDISHITRENFEGMWRLLIELKAKRP